jgi:hypothetical protein
VGTFGTGANALNSYYFKVRDVGSGSTPAFLIRGDGNVGIGTSTPAEKLDVNGNLAINGALNLTGSPGQAGQVATSNGAGIAAQWKSPTNTLYQRTTMVQDTGAITPGGVAVTIPGLSQVISVSGNAKLLIQFGVQATTLDCVGCSASDAQISLTRNGNTEVILIQTIANNNSRAYISGSRVLALGTGTYTFEVKALSVGPVVQFGRCSVCNAQSYLIVQVIPE